MEVICLHDQQSEVAYNLRQTPLHWKYTLLQRKKIISTHTFPIKKDNFSHASNVSGGRPIPIFNKVVKEGLNLRFYWDCSHVNSSYEDTWVRSMNDKSDMIAIIWLFIHIVVAIDFWLMCWMMYDRLHTIIATVIKKSPYLIEELEYQWNRNTICILCYHVSRPQVAVIFLMGKHEEKNWYLILIEMVCKHKRLFENILGMPKLCLDDNCV